jgi:hypothetical protein
MIPTLVGRHCLQEHFQTADSIAPLPPVHCDAIDMVVSEKSEREHMRSWQGCQTCSWDGWSTVGEEIGLRWPGQLFQSCRFFDVYLHLYDPCSGIPAL